MFTRSIAITFLIVQIRSRNHSEQFNNRSETSTASSLTHLESGYVKSTCRDRNRICFMAGDAVCTLRIENSTEEYKEFANSCFQFMNNMCDSPGREFYIVHFGNCDDYYKSRRSDQNVWTISNTTSEKNQNNTKLDFTNGTGTSGLRVASNNFTATSSLSFQNISLTTKNDSDTSNLRANTDATTKPTKLSTKFVHNYTMPYSMDHHLCPLTCPNTYEPYCVNINRGYGKYFRMLQFVNHCLADLYYCKHAAEKVFKAPPGSRYQLVKGSLLGWSYCGSNRYLQFVRFTEAMSSMSHYGWLAGDYKYTHILKPNERIPGYG